MTFPLQTPCHCLVHNDQLPGLLHALLNDIMTFIMHYGTALFGVRAVCRVKG